MDPVAMDKDRPLWQNAKVFGLAIIGAGAGYGSLFRLPYMFDRFGGGTFLVAYLLCLAFVAWPLSLAELLIGQHFRKGAVGAWEQVHVKLAGLGTGSTLFSSCLISIYFSTVLSWTVVPYLGGSFSDPMSYTKHGTSREGFTQYFEETALFDPTADGNEFHTKWPVLASVMGVWLIVLFISWKGFQSAAIAVYVVVPLPLLGVVCMTLYGLSLPGAFATLAITLNPAAEKDNSGGGFLQMDLWAHAVGQSMLTLQAASGVLIAYGSYARPVHNVFKISAAVLAQSLVFAIIFAVCTGVSFASLEGKPNVVVTPSPTTLVVLANTSMNVSGGNTTAAAGNTTTTTTTAPVVALTEAPSASTWTESNSIVVQTSRNGQSGLYVSFVLFPSLFNRMTFGNFWAVVFYGCQSLIGLQTLAAAVSAVFTVLKDHFQWRKNLFLMAAVCLVFAIFALMLSLRPMYPILMAVDTVIISIVLPFFALVEAIGIGYMWSDKSIGEVVSERAGAAGCFGKCKVCLSVTYHHSVNRIQEVMLEARHYVPGIVTSLHPIIIKFIVPAAALIAFIFGIVSLFAYDFFELPELAAAAVLVLLALGVIFLGGCCRSQVATPLPLTDRDLATVTSADGPMGDDFDALANFSDESPPRESQIPRPGAGVVGAHEMAQGHHVGTVSGAVGVGGMAPISLLYQQQTATASQGSPATTPMGAASRSKPSFPSAGAGPAHHIRSASQEMQETTSREVSGGSASLTRLGLASHNKRHKPNKEAAPGVDSVISDDPLSSGGGGGKDNNVEGRTLNGGSMSFSSVHSGGGGNNSTGAGFNVLPSARDDTM